ncbi:MAG: AsnC family transcriptional regulator [Thermoplasmata archaeon]|nr:AsnC family transcriptional regulator [Thermoplasmata archaeon]
MDAKDFRLLVALDENARQSFQSLGRKVALSAPAVRERLRRLEERGILQGFWVSCSPRVFGRKDLLVAFGPEWTREEAVGALGGPDVAWVAWKVDGSVTVEVWPYDVEAGLAAVRRFVGREPTWHGVAGSPWTGELTRVDWRILEALLDTPRAAIGELSVTTRLSPKTIRNRVARLLYEEAIYVVPRLGFLADSGEIVYNVIVAGKVPFAELVRVIGDSELIHETQDPPRKYLFCRADNLGDLTARTHALGKVPGVTSVQLSLNRELFVGTEFVHRLVREQIESSEKALRSKGR